MIRLRGEGGGFHLEVDDQIVKAQLWITLPPPIPHVLGSDVAREHLGDGLPHVIVSVVKFQFSPGNQGVETGRGVWTDDDRRVGGYGRVCGKFGF